MEKEGIPYTLANQITIVRILLIFPFVICMLSIHDPRLGEIMRYTATAIFAVMSISDAADGYLARARKQASRLGTFLDPLADKLLMTCACILLSLKDTSVEGYRLPGAVVVFIIGKDLLLTLGFVISYLLTHHVRIVPLFVGKTQTFLQLVMVLCVLISPEMEGWIPHWAQAIGVLWILTAGLAALAGIIYIWGGIRYIEQFEKQMNKG
jgi:CDP-diacylglycerol--glycerol-3-phosphate 3-phosphatidyltransferase